MSTRITITIDKVQLTAHLNDSATARKVLEQFPLRIQMHRWGDEYYGALPRKAGIGLEAAAREEMAVGELAYWPPGNALCIFFGPTPVSEGEQPRAASPVSPIGMVSDDLSFLRGLGSTIDAALATAQPA